MSMKAFVSFIIVAFVFTMGCASVPDVPREPQRTSAVIDAPKDKVWPLLVEEIGSKYPIQSTEKESGLITTQVVKMPVARGNTLSFKRYIFMPHLYPVLSRPSNYEGLKMNMRITTTESEPGKTMITINAYYEILENGKMVMSSYAMKADSNGSVENQILTNIEDKLKY